MKEKQDSFCGWVKAHVAGDTACLSFTDKREDYVDGAVRGVSLTPVFAHAPETSPASWLTLAEGVPRNGNDVWLHTTRGAVVAACKAGKQGYTGDYFATDGAGDIAMADVLHWMPRVPPKPPASPSPDQSNGAHQ